MKPTPRYPKGKRYCRTCNKNKLRKLRALAKEAVYEVLGSVCAHCGFSDKRALHIDHIEGGGSEDRKKNSHVQFMQKVAKNPIGFQILCANCNWIKRVENGE